MATDPVHLFFVALESFELFEELGLLVIVPSDGFSLDTNLLTEVNI